MTAPLGAECNKVLSEISAYLDGDLDATSCGVIEQHCASCPACAELVRSLRDTVGLCRGAAATPVPDAVRERARASVRALLRGKND